MAADAISDDAGMVKGCRDPGDRRVTVVTGIAARHVAGRLADRNRAVMA